MNTQKQENYLSPFITLVGLFFIVGFLTTMNGQFQSPLKDVFLSEAGGLKNTLATLISFSWFMAYPLTGKVGSNWIARYGYKRTLIFGLYLLILGMGIFWLSSVYTTGFPESYFSIGHANIPWGYVIFLLGSFIAGSAATILQVVINPYLAACEVPHTQSVQRMSIGGTANSVGTTLAPFFVSGIVFGGLSIEDIHISQIEQAFIWLIVLIAIVIWGLSRMRLPDIEGTTLKDGDGLKRSIWSFRHLTLGVIAIFFYVGVEVCVGANINLYAIALEKSGKVFSFLGMNSLSIGGIDFSIPALMATLYWGGMLIGRLISSFMNKISPQWQLGVAAIFACLLTVGAICMDNPWLLVIVGLFHSVMWGAIFALSVNKLGKYTSAAAGVFMIGVIGGALLPVIQGILADVFQGNWRSTWLIVIIGELYILYYAVMGSRVSKNIEQETL